jgi:GrpB-like predicted nucleotidyltransferase (UPF0157 family)
MPLVRFTSEKKIRAKVLATFEKHRRKIRKLLPRSEIHHIGSTAISGALTKGDLDILVRVARAQFPKADSALAAHYRRNRTSWRNKSFSSFKDDEADPPLGIQLTVRGGATDIFTQFRDALVKNPLLVAAYNQLKLECEGHYMTHYRQKKTRFIEKVIENAA